MMPPRPERMYRCELHDFCARLDVVQCVASIVFECAEGHDEYTVPPMVKEIPEGMELVEGLACALAMFKKLESLATA